MNRTLANIGFAMSLIGSIILILFGLAGIFGTIFLIFYPLYALGSFLWGIAMLILGILCAGASRFVYNIGAAIWLIILAIIISILGASYIAWLIALGAIIGLISRL
jgi:hypothetical protein